MTAVIPCTDHVFTTSFRRWREAVGSLSAWMPLGRPPATDAALRDLQDAVQARYQVALPAAYLALLLQHDGISDLDRVVYGAGVYSENGADPASDNLLSASEALERMIGRPLILFGSRGVYLFVLDPQGGTYHILDGSSGQVKARVRDADTLLARLFDDLLSVA